MNKTELNALNKRLAELLGYRIATTFDFKPKAGDVYVAGRCTPDHIGTVYRSASQPGYFYKFTPTTDKTHAMELLKDFELSLEYVKGAAEGRQWQCWKPMIFGSRQTANTPMEAIVRAIIKLLEASHD